MSDEIWTTRDGQEILVGEMSESHVRNALRMVLRQQRLRREKLEATLSIPDESFCRPDNHQILADLRARHGSAVRVEHSSVAGMSGGNVYVNGEWRGWYGGI